VRARSCGVTNQSLIDGSMDPCRDAQVAVAFDSFLCADFGFGALAVANLSCYAER